MKRLLTSLFLVAAMSGISPSIAQDVAQIPEPPRFAFFSLGLLIENSAKAKQIFSELENTQKVLNEKLRVKGEEGKKLQQQLQGTTLSDQGRELLKKQLRDVDFEYKKLQEDSQTEFTRVQQKVYKDIYAIAGPLIEVVAKEQKLQVVFSGTPGQSGQIVEWAEGPWFRAFSQEVAKRFDLAEVPLPKPAATSTTKPATAPTAKPSATAKPAVVPATPPVIKKP
jgi:Skp family chaperone for outer membrane proteins